MRAEVSQVSYYGEHLGISALGKCFLTGALGFLSPFVLLGALWKSWRLSLVFYVNEPLECVGMFSQHHASPALFHKPKYFTCLLILALSINKGGSPGGALLSADGDEHAEGHLTPCTHSWWGDKVTGEMTAHFVPSGSRRKRSPNKKLHRRQTKHSTWI